MNDSYIERARARFPLHEIAHDRLVRAAYEVQQQLNSQLDRRLLELYGYLALTKGTSASRADVHDAWAVVKHETDPTHDWIIPFEELPPHVQEYDQKYVEAIHRAAQALGTSSSS